MIMFEGESKNKKTTKQKNKKNNLLFYS